MLMPACASETGVRPGLATALQQDFSILARTEELLSSEPRWDRNGTQSCPSDATQWSLFCALMKASRDVAGDFQLRRPALNEVRGALQDITGQSYDRRLLDFNNDPNTEFADIRAVLDRAGERLANKNR